MSADSSVLIGFAQRKLRAEEQRSFLDQRPQNDWEAYYQRTGEEQPYRHLSTVGKALLSHRLKIYRARLFSESVAGIGS